MSSIAKLLEEGMETSVVCTEPAAIGLAVSAAFDALRKRIPDLHLEDVEEIKVETDRDVYKNSLGVGVAYDHELKGAKHAAALGIFCDPRESLHLFQNLTSEKASGARKLAPKAEVIPNYGWEELHIEAKVMARNHGGIAHIIGGHSNISYIAVDGEVLFRQEAKDVAVSEFKSWDDLNLFIKEIEDLPPEAERKIREAIEVNYEAFIEAERCIGERGLGALFKGLIKQDSSAQDCINRAREMLSMAVEARMAGFNIKVMTCAGSGNMGLVATLPLKAVAERFGQDGEKLVRAVGLAQLIATYVSEYSGKLSALCGCSIKAGIGLTAGVAYYLLEENSTREQKVKTIGSAINNLAANITGMICDGAGLRCVLKATTATQAAMESALFALEGVAIPAGAGIVDQNPVLTLRNIGKVSEGMVETDRMLIKEILGAPDRQSM